MDTPLRPVPGGLLARLLRMMGGYTLQLASDHLLCTENAGMTYQRRRFFLSDIEQITVRQTARGAIITVVLIAAAIVLFLFSLSIFAFESGAADIGSALTNPFNLLAPMPMLLTAVANLLIGPTCKTYIHTRAHLEHVKSLSRVRTAQRAVRELAPVIEAAQQHLVPDIPTEDLENTVPRPKMTELS